MKHNLVVLAVAAYLAGMAATDASAAGRSGGGAAFRGGAALGGGHIGGHVGGGFGARGLSGSGARLIAGLRVPFLIWPYDIFHLRGLQTNPSQQSSSQNYYYYGINYPGIAENGQSNVAYGGAYGYVGGTRMKAGQTCGEIAGSLTDVPIDQIRAIVHPTNEQQAALDKLAAASSQAKGIIEAACPAQSGLSPVSQLDSSEKYFQAIVQGIQVMRSPLEEFYASLSDEQKAGLRSGVPPHPAASQQSSRHNNETNLKVGTRVKLRSGGPMMAVVSIQGSDVTCVWFDNVGEPQSGTFPAASLM
jgi:uncharacterized protein YodC (DUF2158 family)